MKQSLERKIDTLKKELERDLSVITNNSIYNGISWFIRHNSKTAFQNEWLLSEFEFLYKDIDRCTKEEILDYINDRIDKCTEKLLSGKVIHYNTNPMQNLTEMWEFEIYPHYIKELNSLKGLL